MLITDQPEISDAFDLIDKERRELRNALMNIRHAVNAEEKMSDDDLALVLHEAFTALEEPNG